jgi:carboxyl-terminal processing protease
MTDVPTEDRSSTIPNRLYLGIALALLLASASFFSGLYIGRDTALSMPDGQNASVISFFRREPAAPVEADLTEFWQVWNLMEQKFAAGSAEEALSVEARVEGAIDGLVRAYGDPYSAYLPQTEAAFFDEDISGNFSGVGMEVGLRDNLITVIAPLPGTPAEQAGIVAGDYIVAIDGQTTEGMLVDQAVRLIRGQEGTTVNLTIARRGDTAVREVAIVRAQIEIPTVKTETRDGVFIITLYSFNALAEMKMQEALRDYVRSGNSKLVIDVRGNPGGFLQSAVAIASYFLPTGKVVLRESFGTTEEETIFRSSGRTLKSFAPEEIVVLIDGGSASASEILAGALAYHDVATVVGQSSFGKGSVQELVPLPSGGALKVTVARWLTPGGVSISEGGLTPDIVVERTIADREASRDPQLDAAIQILNGTFVPAESTAVGPVSNLPTEE